MELIDKEQLIEKIGYLFLYPSYPTLAEKSSYCDALEDCKDVIDSIETKDVDLEKEIDKWICDDAITHEDCSITDVISTAKHFFELGLKQGRVRNE